MKTPEQRQPLKDKEDAHIIVKEPESADSAIVLDTKLTEKLVSDTEEALGDAGRRKDYREALKRAGIDMDFLVDNLKNIAMAGEKDSDKIKALQVLLKSLGVDKSAGKDEEEGGGGWEKALLEDDTPIEDKEYQVNEPEMPERARKKREEENAIGTSIYE